MSTAQALAPSAFAPASPAEAPRRLRSLSPHLLLVANGNASGLSRRPSLVKDSAQLLRSIGARVETRITASLEELDHALATAERRVVLLGGDGSLHAAANSRFKTELALIPAGGANNIARSLGIPADFAAAARLAVEGRARPIDAIAVETATQNYLAVEGVSAGFHALARVALHGDELRGRPRGHSRRPRRSRALRAVHDRAVARRRAAVSCASASSSSSNMPLFGPGLRVAPADPRDGLLDVVTIDGGRRALLGLAPRLRRGTHLGRPGVTHTRARTIRIATGGRSPVIADTTNVGDTVQLSIAPHALDIVGAAA